jgi:hypothetical protein
MMVISFRQGQKHYPIPYAWRKLTAYVAIAVIFYLLYFGVRLLSDNTWVALATATALLSVFMWFIGLVEKREFSRLPVIGKFYKIAPAAIVPSAVENSKA